MTGQARRPLQGVCEILVYNRHQYLGAIAVLLCASVLLLVDLPSALRLVVILTIGVVGYWTFASIAVSYIVYDAKPIYDPKWMRTLLDHEPSKWANLHAGVDDFSQPLSVAYGKPLYNWDIFDDDAMTEPSILRARSIRASPQTASNVDFRSLPCDDGELEAVFAFFVLHEIRDPSLRRDCFGEIARCTAPGGKLIIVEHLRDAPNFLAFGPGFLHFLSRAEWMRLASESAFELLSETTMTPFVRFLILGRAAHEARNRA